VKGFVRALNRGIKDAQADRAAGIVSVLKREALLNAAIERERFDLMYSFDMSAPEMKDVGLGDWVDYFQRVAALPVAVDATSHAEQVEALNATGLAVIGTPDDAIAQIQRLTEQSGGFGTYLLMAHEWADRRETLRSFELFSRYVMPVFQRSAATLVASRDWAAANRPEFIGAAAAAVVSAIERHKEERAGAGPAAAG